MMRVLYVREKGTSWDEAMLNSEEVKLYPLIVENSAKLNFHRDLLEGGLGLV